MRFLLHEMSFNPCHALFCLRRALRADAKFPQRIIALLGACESPFFLARCSAAVQYYVELRCKTEAIQPWTASHRKPRIFIQRSG